MGTAIKHPVSDRVMPSFVIFLQSFVIFGIRAPGCQKLQMMATVGIQGLSKITGDGRMNKQKTVGLSYHKVKSMLKQCTQSNVSPPVNHVIASFKPPNARQFTA